MASTLPGGSLEESDVTTLGGGAGVTVVGRLAGRTIHFAAQVVLARGLGASLFGVFALGWTLVRLLETLGTLGLHNGVVRFASPLWASHPAGARRMIWRSVILGVTSGSLIAVALLAASDWLAYSVFAIPELATAGRLFAVVVPLVVGTRIAAAATRASQRMRFSVLVEDIGQPLLFLILILVAFALGWGFIGVVAVLGLSFLVAFTAGCLILRGLIPRDEVATADRGASSTSLLRYSIPTALAGALGNYVLWIDRLFIGYFRSASDVGTYQVAVQLTVPFIIVVTAFNAVFGPMIAELHPRGEHARLESLFRISTKWGLYVSLPLFLVVIFAGESLILTIFGEQYRAALAPLLILMTGQMINVASGGVATLLIMTGHQNRWLYITIASLAASVALNWFLVPRFGNVGAAVGTSMVVAGMFVAGVVSTRKMLGLWAYDGRYLKGLAAAASTALVLAVVDAMIKSWRPLPALVLMTSISFLVFGLSLLWLGLGSEDRVFLSHLLRRAAR